MLTIGVDAEVFLRDGDGRYKSAIPLIDATPQDRITMKNGATFYHDNMLAEFATTPCTTASDLIRQVDSCIAAIEKHTKHKATKIPCAVFDDEEWQDPRAQVAGCSQEFCAYSLKILDPPVKKMQTSGLRTAGAHIHIGHPFLLQGDANGAILVRILDALIGVPVTMNSSHRELEVTRRTMYGVAGAHRPKPYGVEYRVLSPIWLIPTAITAIWDIICAVFYHWEYFRSMYDFVSDEDGSSLKLSNQFRKVHSVMSAIRTPAMLAEIDIRKMIDSCTTSKPDTTTYEILSNYVGGRIMYGAIQAVGSACKYSK